MNRFLLGAACAVLLGGCASHWIYDKPSFTAGEVDRDKAACAREAPSRSVFAVFLPEPVDREAFNRCMQQRGYSVRLE